MLCLRVAGVCALAGLIVACSGGRARPVGATASPPMDGPSILQRACTTCHDLGGLSAYASYWGEPEWRSMVETMLSYGAELTPEEETILSRYLGLAYGTGTRR